MRREAAAIVAAAGLLAACSGHHSPHSTGSATGSRSSIPPTTPAVVPNTSHTPTPVSAPPTQPVTLPPTPLTAAAQAGAGLRVQVQKVSAGTSTAHGPKEVAGQPCVVFVVQATNTSQQAIALNTVQVTADYGAARTPAVPVNQSIDVPLSGSVPAGQQRTGTYTFAIPIAQRVIVRLSVWFSADRPTVVFAGAAPTG